MSTAGFQFTRVPSAAYEDPEEKLKRKVRGEVDSRIEFLKPERVPSPVATAPAPQVIGPQDGLDAAMTSFVPTRVPPRQSPAPIAGGQPNVQQLSEPPSVLMSQEFTRVPSKQIAPQAGFDAAMQQNHNPGDQQFQPPAPQAVNARAGFDEGMKQPPFTPWRVPSKSQEPAPVPAPDTPDRPGPVRAPSTSVDQQEPARTMHEGSGHSRWKDALAAFLEGLAMPQQSSGDPRQDVFNRLGAGAGSIAVGAVNPQAVHDYRYRKDLAKFQGEQERRLELAQKETAQRKAVGDITGIDPKTGKPTQSAQTATSNQNFKLQGLSLRERQLLLNQEKADATKEERKQKFAHLQNAEMLKAYNSGAYNRNPEALRAFGDRLGEALGVDFDTIPDKFLSGTIKQIIDSSGNFGTQNLQTNTATPTLDASGKPVGSLAGEKTETQKEQFNRRQSETERHNTTMEGILANRPEGGKVTTGQVWGVINKVQSAIDNAKQLQARGSAKAGSAAEEARALAAQARDMYGDHVEVGGLDGDGIPYIKSRTGASGGSGNLQTATPLRKHITQQEYQKLLQGKDKATVDARLKAKGIEVR